MKISFEFDGDDCMQESRLYFHARELYCALWDVDQECRSRMKYCEDVSDIEYAFLEKLRDMCQLCRDLE